jgi:hypothetical protein
MRSSHGKITHLRAGTPSGRVVEHPGVAITVGWEDEQHPGVRAAAPGQAPHYRGEVLEDQRGQLVASRRARPVSLRNSRRMLVNAS